MLIFDILKHGSSTMNFNSFDNIAWIIKCDLSKSKLALSTSIILQYITAVLPSIVLYHYSTVYSCCATINCAIPLFYSILLLCYHQLCYTIILQYITVALPSIVLYHYSSVYYCCATINCAIPLFYSIFLLCYHQLCYTIILQYIITVVLPSIVLYH